MNPEWISKERWLWDHMTDPGRVHRKHRRTAHSLSKKDPEYKRVMMEIEKQKARDFADGWAAYGLWIGH